MPSDPDLLGDDLGVARGPSPVPGFDPGPVVGRPAFPVGAALRIGHLDEPVMIMFDVGPADRGPELDQVMFGVPLVRDQEHLDPIEGRDRLAGQVIEIAAADADHQHLNGHS